MGPHFQLFMCAEGDGQGRRSIHAHIHGLTFT